MCLILNACEDTRKVDYSKEYHLSSFDLWDLASNISEMIISHYYGYIKEFILKALCENANKD